jgi:hypothetical protein
VSNLEISKPQKKRRKARTPTSMSQQLQLGIVFGDGGVYMNARRRGPSTLTRMGPGAAAAMKQCTGKFLPPYVASLASGALDAGQTLQCDVSWLRELVFHGGRLERVGGATGALVGMIQSNTSNEPNLARWVAAGESLGLPSRSAVPMLQTHNSIRKQRRGKASGAPQPRVKCESVNHTGKRPLGDPSLRPVKLGDPGYGSWIACRLLHGDLKMCLLCRKFAARRGAVKAPDEATQRRVSVPFPNTSSLESLAASTFGAGSERSAVSKAVVALKERCTVMVCVGALMAEPLPAAAHDWQALYSRLTLIGSAVRCGALAAFLNVIIPKRSCRAPADPSRAPSGTPSSKKIWIMAAFMDSGSLAAAHIWALVNTFDHEVQRSQMLAKLMQEQAVAVSMATVGRAELPVGPPQARDETFFALADEAIASYQATPMPQTVQYIFFKVPGTMPGTKSTVCCRAWFDVVNALKRGWKLSIVLTGPLAPEKILPALPVNSVHALVEVLPNDIMKRARLDPRLSKPARYPSPPAIVGGEYLTWGVLASHLALRRAQSGRAAPASMYTPLVVYMSLSRALGGAEHTYRLSASNEITLAYGSCARDLVQLQRAQQPASITLEHGTHADFSLYRPGGRHARLVKEAYARDVAWLGKPVAGEAAQIGHTAISTTALWDAM